MPGEMDAPRPSRGNHGSIPRRHTDTKVQRPQACTETVYVAFGLGAQAVADRLARSDVIVSAFPIPQDAYLEAIDRRISGEPCYGMILFEDSRARVARDLAPALLKASDNQDGRRDLFDQLAEGKLLVNGTPCSELARVLPEHALLSAEFLRLCSGTLTWSHAEAERIVSTLGYRPQLIERVALPHALPKFARRRAEQFSVVVWAPECAPSEATLLAFALEELHAQVFVVCANGGEVPTVRAEFVRCDDPRVPELLSGAGCVVVASLSDTGAALAFAQHGVPLAVASTSGAHELISNAFPFEPWNWKSVLHAVLNTAGRPTSPASAIEPPPLRVSPTDWSAVEAPLVTVIVPTYDRLKMLRDCLEFHSKQTYPALEILVVNDGGESPAAIVSDFPRARLVDLAENLGPEAAVAVGVRHARGKYVGIVPDDDHLYPDHVERLVDVLERTGAMVAHANALVRYQRCGDDGRYHDFAYNASTFVHSMDAGTGMAVTSLINSSWLARREVYEMLAGLDRSSQYVEMLDQLSIITRHDFVHVDHVTNDWVLREESGLWRKRAKGNPEQLRAVYERFPLADRPGVEEMRRRVLDSLAQQQDDRDFFFPPTVTLDAPRTEAAI
jgi:hypothetical protein